MSQQSIIVAVYGELFSFHGLVSGLTCFAKRVTLYTLVCAFPNQVQSIAFVTAGLSQVL